MHSEGYLFHMVCHYCHRIWNTRFFPHCMRCLLRFHQNTDWRSSGFIFFPAGSQLGNADDSFAVPDQRDAVENACVFLLPDFFLFNPCGTDGRASERPQADDWMWDVKHSFRQMMGHEVKPSLVSLNFDLQYYLLNGHEMCPVIFRQVGSGKMHYFWI